MFREVGDRLFFAGRLAEREGGSGTSATLGYLPVPEHFFDGRSAILAGKREVTEARRAEIQEALVLERERVARFEAVSSRRSKRRGVLPGANIAHPRQCFAPALMCILLSQS